MKSATRHGSVFTKRPLSSVGVSSTSNIKNSFSSTSSCTPAPTTFSSSFSMTSLFESLSRKKGSNDFESTHQRWGRSYSTHPRPTSTQDIGKRLTILDILERYKKGIPITMLTAKDFPSAVIIQQSTGIDIILVGDSLGMTTLGYESTVPVTMIDMVHHAKAVARGNKTSFLIGDLPFGSYEPSSDLAVTNAMVFVKEAGMNGVKLEGGRRMADRARAIRAAGIPVMGHVGLTPQHIHTLGGFKVQGKTAQSAEEVLDDALALQEAGCFAVVLECVPYKVAEVITNQLSIPTIGIGSGNRCSGQVLVWDDMVGQSDIQSFQPKFLKKYASVYDEMRKAVEDYRNEVVARKYPEDNTHTFTIKEEELDLFVQRVEKRNNKNPQQQQEQHKEKENK